MGTTTLYLKRNDFARSFKAMTKEELEKLSSLSPYSKNQSYLGWDVPLELHNGNVYILVFWKGKLMKLGDAPQQLNRKYYDKYKCKVCKEYEWTLLKGMMLKDIKYLDKNFKREIKKTLKTKSDLSSYRGE